VKNYLSNYNKRALKIIRKIGQEADKRKLSAYVVGGVVRDVLLRRNNLDIDIVVEGDAITFAEGLQEVFDVRFVFHQKFGTANAVFLEGLCVDLTSARQESYPFPGALPEVCQGTLKQDLFRRDFTINAIALSINHKNFGELVDEWGGLKDLQANKIRIIHNKSFIDDPTRILRAVRFEQRFGFNIERHTLRLLKEALKKDFPDKVKPQRYFSEFKKILNEDNPKKGIERLEKLDGLKFLGLQNVGSVRVVHNNINFIKERIDSVWLIYFMALISRASIRSQENILKKFQFKKEEKASMIQFRKREDIVKFLSAKILLSSEVYRLLKPLRGEVVLYLRAQTRKKMVCHRIDRFWDKDRMVELKITGDDLKRMGVCSGEKIGRVLKETLYQKVDKGLRTKKEEVNFIKSRDTSHFFKSIKL